MGQGRHQSNHHNIKEKISYRFRLACNTSRFSSSSHLSLNFIVHGSFFIISDSFASFVDYFLHSSCLLSTLQPLQNSFSRVFILSLLKWKSIQRSLYSYPTPCFKTSS